MIEIKAPQSGQVFDDGILQNVYATAAEKCYGPAYGGKRMTVPGLRGGKVFEQIIGETTSVKNIFQKVPAVQPPSSLAW